MLVASQLMKLAQELHSCRDHDLNILCKKLCLAVVILSHEAIKKQHFIFPIFSKRVNQ